MHATAFVSGPYAPIPSLKLDIVDNVSTAEACAIWLWNHDYYVFCPHLNTRYFGSYSPVPEQRYVAFYLSVIRSGLIDLLVLLPYWELSSGTDKEFRLARSLQIPILLWSPTSDTLTRIE